MNIQFTVMAHGFDKAAAIEKALKELGCPYDTVISKSRNAPKQKRATVDKVQLAVILACIDKNPEWDDKEVGRSTGIGRNTVNRIRRGLHALQQNGKK